jgi:hypothetical protein
MTVRAIVPIVEYIGNGVITRYDWDWDMIEDSTIGVIVDNFNVFNWSLEGQSVVFNTAPDDGAEITIYRRTLIYMPENYRAFGRFHSEKTELSVDRAIMIAQERAGDRQNGNIPNGIVGGADLSMTRAEFALTVNSERGTDAVLNMWDYDDTTPIPPTPDPTIIWAGDDLSVGIYSLPNNTNGVAATMTWRMDLSEGDPAEASVSYPDYNVTAYVGWVNIDPADDAYWMRVNWAGDPLPESRYQINDGDNNRNIGDEFKIRGRTLNPVFGPFLSVFTFGDTAPSVRLGVFNVEICKDSSGIPDGAWVSRICIIEAIFNE